jgi:hypothetical protein
MVDAALNHLLDRLNVSSNANLDLLALCDRRCLRGCVANTLARLGWKQRLLKDLNATLPQTPDPSGERHGGVLLWLMGE